jgi:PPOX class probable FMN-dependent enzyme
MRFEAEVRSQAALRAVMGPPAARALDKELAALDSHCRDFIALSPFVLVGSSDGAGRVDVSPRGDAPGFVAVLDDRTLAIPERPGNRRADTLSNVLRHPPLALLFMIPGKAETLRVGGEGLVVRDAWLRERLAVQGKAPELVLVVRVARAFLHCARCALRSRLWELAAWPDVAGLASHARCLVDHARLAQPVEAVQAGLDEAYRTRLY